MNIPCVFDSSDQTIRTMIQRDNLVVVRAGDTSLHPQWLSSAQRNWDLAVSYYGDYPERYRDQYDLLHVCKGPKWEGIADFLDSHRDLVRNYRHVWFPDDDLLTDAENIDRFFAICAEADFTIAQPALTRYSYYTWPITRRIRGTIFRRTNFVEIMAPCFKVEALPLFEPTFRLSSTCWGVEWLWWNIAEKANVARFGIVDRTPVHHTRKVGSAGSGGAAGSPWEEMRKLMDEYKLQEIAPQVLGSYPSPWRRFLARLSRKD